MDPDYFEEADVIGEALLEQAMEAARAKYVAESIAYIRDEFDDLTEAERAFFADEENILTNGEEAWNCLSTPIKVLLVRNQIDQLTQE